MEPSSAWEPIGVVEGGRESPIRLEQWVAWILGDARLRPPEPVVGTNPFDRRPLTVAPQPGTAYVLEGTARVGMMAWSEEGLDQIVVYGRSEHVVAVAREVAEGLGARFR